MANFRSPSRGGNVVHNLDFPGLGRGGAARRSARVAARRRRPLAQEARIEPAEPAAKPARIYVLPKAPKKAPTEDPATEAATEARQGRSMDPAVQDSQARKQIDVLERRLAKMARLLDQRDTEIVSRSRPPEDKGVSSIYRDVQGLEGQGDEAQQKRDLMSSIFEANLKLREMVTSSAKKSD